MYLVNFIVATYAVSEVATAFKLPFDFRLPWVSAQLNNDEQVILAALPEEPSNRIAIIGAGAGGSAAAFWIGKAKERYGLDVDIDVFDSNSYIGGRSTTVHPYDDPNLEPIELGASVFVEANKNLWRASDEFGFERQDFEEGEDTMGIWDGEQFLITTSAGTWGGWWNTVKFIWRYGIKAPSKTKTIVAEMIEEFLTLYTAEAGATPFHNITALSLQRGWDPLVSASTVDYFDSLGVDKRWTREVIEGATRVNYGQNVDGIHALEGLCSLAADGASQVRGGNWQIFEQFVKRSGASVHLNTTVVSINQLNEDKYVLRTRSSLSASSAITERDYRAVILAAPFHSSSIDLSLQAGAAAPVIPPQPYVHLHVTLLSTPHANPRTRFFGLKDGDKVPAMVLTSWESVRSKEDSKAPEFNSLSYHGKIKGQDGLPANITREDGTSGEEWSVKIFSTQRLEDRWLRRAFGKVGWVHRKEWDAYPVLPPTNSFPPIKLAKGLYYVNAFEPFISTMETETLSARNVVELLLQEEYNASICKKSESETTEEKGEDFIYGWDC